MKQMIQTLLHEMLLKSREDILQKFQEPQLMYPLEPHQTHLLQALLLSTLQEDVIELLGF